MIRLIIITTISLVTLLFSTDLLAGNGMNERVESKRVRLDEYQTHLVENTSSDKAMEKSQEELDLDSFRIEELSSSHVIALIRADQMEIDRP